MSPDSRKPSPSFQDDDSQQSSSSSSNRHASRKRGPPLPPPSSLAVAEGRHGQLLMSAPDYALALSLHDRRHAEMQVTNNTLHSPTSLKTLSTTLGIMGKRKKHKQLSPKGVTIKGVREQAFHDWDQGRWGGERGGGGGGGGGKEREGGDGGGRRGGGVQVEMGNLRTINDLEEFMRDGNDPVYHPDEDDDGKDEGGEGGGGGGGGKKGGSAGGRLFTKEPPLPRLPKRSRQSAHIEALRQQILLRQERAREMQDRKERDRERDRQEREERRREERKQDREDAERRFFARTQMTMQMSMHALGQFMSAFQGGGGQPALGQAPQWVPPVAAGGGGENFLMAQPPIARAPQMPLPMPPYVPDRSAHHAPGGGAPGPQTDTSWYPGTNSGVMGHGEDDELEDVGSGRPPTPAVPCRPPLPPVCRRSPRGHENKGREA